LIAEERLKVMARNDDDDRTYRSRARKKLADIIRLRSGRYTIIETAQRLGLMPWEVSYLTQVAKVVVSADEVQYMEEEAEKHGFNTIGELMMDVFNRTYEKHYTKELKGPKKAKAPKRLKKGWLCQ
jgi:hypothetical protein